MTKPARHPIRLHTFAPNALRFTLPNVALGNDSAETLFRNAWPKRSTISWLADQGYGCSWSDCANCAIA